MKKSSVLLFILALGQVGFASDPTVAEGTYCAKCEVEKAKAGAGLKEVSKAIGEKMSCDSKASTQAAAEAVKAVVASDGLKSVVKVLMEPSSRTSSSVTYKMNPQITLQPGETIYLAVPGDLQSRAVSFMVLGHRQDPTTEKGTNPETKWDDVPGLTSVQIHAKNFAKGKQWRYWNGPASGKQGAKFAEVRSDLELENLYGWLSYGSVGLEAGDSSTAEIDADAIRVQSVGKDPVHIGEISLKVLPPEADEEIVKIFTPGTEFAKKVGATPKMGGGQAFMGKFPNAVELKIGKKSSGAALPEGWTLESGDTISIPIPKGKTITSVEVIGGDSHPDEKHNSDGGWGTQGWARISMGVSQGGASPQWFLENENVPPEGVMIGTPKGCGAESSSGGGAGGGDRLIIKGSRDSLYMMGIKVGLKKKNE